MEQEITQLLQHPMIVEALDHIATLNDDYTRLAVDVGVLKSQMATVLKLQWAVVIAIMGFVGSKILVKVFNNNKK